MKHSITLGLTLLGLGLPFAAQAACDRYPNATLSLSLPATITVPDSLPVGSVIIRQPFSGVSEGFKIVCATATPRYFTGRYTSSVPVPGAGVTAHPTNVPGVGIRVMVKDFSGLVYPHSLISSSGVVPGGTTHYSNVSAEAIFYKIGQVSTETLPAGSLLQERWGPNFGFFTLYLNNSPRFIRPAATCDLATGDVTRTITLPPVKVSAFNDAVTAGARDFELTANCANATNVTFRFSGTPAPGNPLLFANTGTSAGVALWLYSRLSGSPQTISNNGVRTLIVSGNRAVVPLGAAYHKNGTVTQGTLAATTTVNITYN